jgi:hypothetical protein
MSYTWEKTYTAVLILAYGTGILQSRLANAYSSALMNLEPNHFPAELRGKFAAIRKAFEQAPPDPIIGMAEASMNMLDEGQARALAEEIVNLYSGVVLLEAAELREIFLGE